MIVARSARVLAGFDDADPDVTLDEVADRAALRVATLHRRFRNRDQVVRAMLSTEAEPVTTAHTDHA